MTADFGVSARDEIRELLTRYCRGVDRMDAELIASAYHPDAIDEHGMTQFTGETVGAVAVSMPKGARSSAQLSADAADLRALADRISRGLGAP